MVGSNLFKRIKDIFICHNDTCWLLSLLFVALIGASITIFGGDLNSRNLSTPFFYSSFVVIYIWFGFKIFFMIKNHSLIEIKPLVILGTAFLIGLFNIVVQTPFSSYSFNYFKKIIITFTVLFLIFLMSYGKFNKIIKIIMPSIALLLSLEIAISYFSGIGKIYANQTTKNLLYFTFGNSNAAGIYFALIILLNTYGIFALKWYMKIACAISNGFLFYLLYLTHARNAIIGLLMCLLVFVMVMLSNKQKINLYDRIVLLISCLMPITIITLYTILGTKTNVLEFLNHFFATSGKTTTSRIISWVAAFKHLNGIHFFIGDYYNSTTRAYTLFQTIAGYQNSQIDFFVDEGLIPALLILAFIYVCALYRLNGINKRKAVNYIPIILWLFTVFSSIFEGGLFICMNIWYVFGFSFLSLGCFSSDGFIVKNEESLYHSITI